MALFDGGGSPNYTKSRQRDIAEPLSAYVVELLDGVHGQWIGGGTFMLAGAALNRSLN